MSIITIFLFFVYLYGFGFTLTRVLKLKGEGDAFQRHVMRLGLGLVMFIVVGTILSMLRIPLYWWLFLILSLAFPMYTLILKRKKLRKVVSSLDVRHARVVYMVLLILFLFNVFMYVKGSFAYPYMEDDDPWTYVREMKFVATEKTLNVPYFRPDNYLDPYPPAYTLLMGVLHQTSPEAQWTIKFFNSLVISLSVLFFFFMVRRLTGSDHIALASTFVLSMLPSYLSHFVWSHSLIPGLFFLLIYGYEQIAEDKRWMWVAGIVTAGILLTHPHQAIKLAIMMGLYFVVKWVYTKRFLLEVFSSAVVGLVLSLSWWAFKFKGMVAMQTRGGGTEGLASAAGGVVGSSLFSKLGAIGKGLLDPSGGSATRAYSFSDFFVAQKGNMINQPIGWGIVVTLLLVLTIIVIAVRYEKLKEEKNSWIVIVLLWFVFTFLFVNSETFNLPIGFEAFRMWMLLAIPVSILAGEGIVLAMNSIAQIKYVVLIVLVVALFMTSGYQKYYHNTTPGWPPGGRFVSGEELGGFIWMKDNLPLNSNVFSYSSKVNKFVYGVNMNACLWCESYQQLKKEGVLEKDMTFMHQWLKGNGYQYVIFTARGYKWLKKEFYKENEEWTEAKVQELFTQRVNEAAQMKDKFSMVYQANGFVAFKVL